MAGERTRRFTRSLLRPGQAAELRHSAASAAAVAVSSRQQQRVSVARPLCLPARPGQPGDQRPASLNIHGAPAPVAPALFPSTPSCAVSAGAPGAISARQCHNARGPGARLGTWDSRMSSYTGSRSAAWERMWSGFWAVGRWLECIPNNIGARLWGGRDLRGGGVYRTEPVDPQVCASSSPRRLVRSEGRM